MNAAFLVLVVLFPIIAGALIPLLPFKNRLQMMIYTEAVVLVNSAVMRALGRAMRRT